jgi:hypothetical protein
MVDASDEDADVIVKLVPAVLAETAIGWGVPTPDRFCDIRKIRLFAVTAFVETVAPPACRSHHHQPRPRMVQEQLSSGLLD